MTDLGTIGESVTKGHLTAIGRLIMAATKWKNVHLYQCPCGYEYEPEKGDAEKGWHPGTSFEELPEFCTCPSCQRAKVHFREKKYSVPVYE
jgi:rubredoxin